MYFTSSNSLNVHLQYITIPTGIQLIDYDPIEVIEDDSNLIEYYSYQDKVYCKLIDLSFGYSVFGKGKNKASAKASALIVKGSKYPVYFQGNGDSYLIRCLMEINAKHPTHIDTSHFAEFKIGYTTTAYKYKDKILLKGDTYSLLFSNSGDDTYPLGSLIWGERYTETCCQYIGNNKSVGADGCLLWKLNETSYKDALNYNKATAR